jgi:DNA-directed RNA polymerase specialized sigma24 family protein
MSGELRGVSSDDVRPFTKLVERVAHRYHGVRGAEYDDLYQEGMVAVCFAITYGFIPDEDDVKDRVRSWVRHVSREGMGGFDEALFGD